MKFTITGSLGHISKPLAEILVKQGHDVTVISSKQDKKPEIEAFGAKAAIGTIEDASFLARAFSGADAIYLMEPPLNFRDQDVDFLKHHICLANTFVKAVSESGVKRVVHLSSIGAHTNKGNGMLAYHYEVEKILNQLPPGVGITFLRPVGFYYNLYAFIPGIKTQGTIVTNYGELTEPWVSPLDIADAAAEEIVKPFTGRHVRYVASEEISCDDVAKTLGEAVGKPDIEWKVISDEDLVSMWLSFGMNAQIAVGYAEMNAGRRTGVLYEDYYRNRPKLGKVKLKDFAKDFAAAYNAGS